MAYECANPTILEPLAYVILSLLGLSLSHSATVDRNGAIPKSPLLVHFHQLDFSFNSNFNPWGCLIPLRHTHSHIVHKVFLNFVILNNMKFLLSVLAVFAFVAYANCGKALPSNRFEWFSFCFSLIFFFCAYVSKDCLSLGHFGHMYHVYMLRFILSLCTHYAG